MRFTLFFFVLTAMGADLEFNRDVRPILSDKCFHCHGPDAAAKKVPVRLDSPSAATGKLVERITHAKPGMRMPPPYSGLKLSGKEIETLSTWVAQGAKWEKHWSFHAPKRAAPPAVSGSRWVRNPIDSFVLARLEQEGLRPSKEAPRETLLRRVSLDLTGLPAELDSNETYEQAVERLLASPRYGERMAMRWLDAARYADSNGYQYDGERVMWRWRDWVIEAFNRNQPYDRFVTEQLAGDLLPDATLDQKIATGFNRNHRANTEDGIIPEEYAVEYVADRAETTGAVFLGLTVGCARCHNHKYDPISQKEFYQLYAYFNNVPELGRAMKYGNSPPMIPAPTKAQQERLAELNALIAAEQRKAPGEFRYQPYRGLDTAGNYDIEDPYTLSAWVKPEAGAGEVRLITRMQDRLHGKGYGLQLNDGKLFFHITSQWVDDGLRLEAEKKLAEGERVLVAATYDGSRSASGVRILINGKPVKTKVLMDTLYRPLGNAGVAFKAELKIHSGLQDTRLYSRVLGDDELAALNAPPAPAEARAARRRLDDLLTEREKFERSLPTVMVMAERTPVKETHLLLRGAYDKPGEVVTPGVPAVLPPLPAGAPNNRLGLAQWMVSKENPLTARVAVNRAWELHFGMGLVETSEDFGAQGDWPSHPELLDWLATWFVESGWDVKALHRLIVTSAAYRQDSAATAELTERDPKNRLLARGPRHRLPAEMLRDQALAAAGMLTGRVGGPSVKPYQPDGLWGEISMQNMDYEQSHGPDLYRRGLYTFWKRTIAPPMLANFDAAHRESCVVRISRTNTPLQALNLMNDVTFLEAARVLAQRMLSQGAGAEERLAAGFRRLTARAPKAREMAVLRGALDYHRDYFSTDAKRAEAYVRQGEWPVAAGLDRRELASYMAVASLMLNMDETLSKE
jgi:hypothetical protein